MRRLSPTDIARLQEVIAAHRERLEAVRGFLGAEPGFPVSSGRLIREPAIIVYVSRKLPETHLLPEERAPDRLGDDRVDVIEADPWKALELDPVAQDLAAELDAAALAANYEGLPGDPIDESFEVERPLLCHVGPDSGWTTLRDFLQGTRETLTVAMYDFSADHISTALIEHAREEDVAVKLTLDDDRKQAERDIQDKLKDKLGARYQAEVIFCGGEGKRFPSAYHPKVAVQDGKRFWLSSGNWSPSSQPAIDPLNDAAARNGMYGKGNREWHIIVEDRPLARLFERYILHDKAKAEEDAALGDQASIQFPDLFVPIEALIAEGGEAAALAAADPVPPAQLPEPPVPVRIQPLLSPDNYARRISEWLRGAQRSLYLQYSYINYSERDVDAPFRALLDDLAEFSVRDDFDLRIIVNSRDKDKVRELAENGFDETKIRVQSGIHNKGVVRDGTEVLVSSQNWSGDGFLRNRDAGLIIRNEQVARYFEQIFLDDWEMRTRDPFEAAGLAAIIAPPGEPPPAGMVRMAWSDYFGE